MQAIPNETACNGRTIEWMTRMKWNIMRKRIGINSTSTRSQNEGQRAEDRERERERIRKISNDNEQHDINCREHMKHTQTNTQIHSLDAINFNEIKFNITQIPFCWCWWYVHTNQDDFEWGTHALDSRGTKTSQGTQATAFMCRPIVLTL